MKTPRYLIVVAALAAVAGLMFLYNGKDWLIRNAVVKATEQATGVSVHLGSLRIELTKGSGLLKDFRLGNPQGFSREDLLSIGKGQITLDVASVTGSVIRIKSVDMDNVGLLFEGSGKANNMKALEDQINAKSAGPKNAKEEKSKKIRIDSFVLKDVKMDVHMSGILKVGNLNLGTIKFEDLGGKEGAPASEIASIISKKITARAMSAMLSNLPKLAEQMGMDVSKIGEGFGLPTGVLNDAAGFFQNLFK